MDSIQIQSRLYDYEVAFTDDFAKDFKDYADAAVYVIDKNVYDFNTEKFQAISSEKIFFPQNVLQTAPMKICVPLSKKRRSFLLCSLFPMTSWQSAS